MHYRMTAQPAVAHSFVLYGNSDLSAVLYSVVRQQSHLPPNFKYDIHTSIPHLNPSTPTSSAPPPDRVSTPAEENPAAPVRIPVAAAVEHEFRSCATGVFQVWRAA